MSLYTSLQSVAARGLDVEGYARAMSATVNACTLSQRRPRPRLWQLASVLRPLAICCTSPPGTSYAGTRTTPKSAPRQIAAPRTRTYLIFEARRSSSPGLPAARRARPGAPYLAGQLLIVKASLSQSLHERRTRGAAQRPPQHNSSPRRHRADSAPPSMEAKGSEDETKDAKEEEPPSKVVIDLLNFAMRVVHEEMSGFFEQPDRGVPRCCGAFTPSS